MMNSNASMSSSVNGPVPALSRTCSIDPDYSSISTFLVYLIST
jgi:hypothetical protein